MVASLKLPCKCSLVRERGTTTGYRITSSLVFSLHAVKYGGLKQESSLSDEAPAKGEDGEARRCGSHPAM